MDGLVLKRLAVRARRRKPRPPRWWLFVGLLTLIAGLAIWAAAQSAWLSLAANGFFGAACWRNLHSPPTYWDDRAYWRYWPIGMALAIGGLFVN